jgi:hypothetical protein
VTTSFTQGSAKQTIGPLPADFLHRPGRRVGPIRAARHNRGQLELNRRDIRRSRPAAAAPLAQRRAVHRSARLCRRYRPRGGDQRGDRDCDLIIYGGFGYGRFRGTLSSAVPLRHAGRGDRMCTPAATGHGVWCSHPHPERFPASIISARWYIARPPWPPPAPTASPDRCQAFGGTTIDKGCALRIYNSVVLPTTVGCVTREALDNQLGKSLNTTSSLSVFLIMRAWPIAFAARLFLGIERMRSGPAARDSVSQTVRRSKFPAPCPDWWS